jgi:methionyl-tRNA synthetase
MDRYYITTAIPYVNGPPHIGHGLEFVQADACARYHRLCGQDTYFLTGSDDNSLNNVRAAEAEGIPTAQLVERNTRAFLRLHELLDISYDQFIRTSVDERHRRGAQKLWRACERAGDIYKKSYQGLYCVSCELFYEEDELVDGLCPEHLRPLELVEEENYFFRLSRYQHRLEELIASDTYQIIPTTRRNEVLSFIRSGLQDFSISRSRQRARGWGIPVPGDDEQVIYVWFDALSNYITALGYADDGELYHRYWVENPNRVHVIGKGIIRFHAVYWPAMLLSAGVPLPQTLFVHGYYTVEGRRMGKSMGNAIDPTILVERYGTDAVRYYFLAATHPTADADFSIASVEARYNADLANDLGNLLNRTVSMINRYRHGIVPAPPMREEPERDLQALAEGLLGRVDRAMATYDHQAALAAIWELVTRANKYVEERAPWNLAKAARTSDTAGEEASTRLDATLYTLAEALRLIAAYLDPFLPRTAGRIREQLGLSAVQPTGAWRDQLVWGQLSPGTHVGQPQPLFPRLETPAGAALS